MIDNDVNNVNEMECKHDTTVQQEEIEDDVEMSENITEKLEDNSEKPENNIEQSKGNVEQELYKPFDNNNQSNNDIMKEKGEELPNEKNEGIENKDVYKKLSRIIDSDSEDENMFISKLKSKKLIYESSEDETTEGNQDMLKAHLNNRNDADEDSNNDSNGVSLNDNSKKNEKAVLSEKQITNIIPNRFQSLIDSDSDSEREESEKENNEELSSPIKNNKRAKIQNGKDSKSKPRKVSQRAAKEEAMKEIHSETQRLLREREISLPYHRPKQRTLQEFLNRKKIITALPKAPSMAAKLKMSSAIVDEVLKEKEKEAEIFYKSSDSEEETIENDLSDKEDTNTENKQECENNIVPRKLFIDNIPCIDGNEKQNDINVTQETHEMHKVLTVTGRNEDTEVVAVNEEKDANDSMIVEIHCDFNDVENKNEISKSENIGLSETFDNIKGNDTSLEKGDIEVLEKEHEVENVYNNNEESKTEVSKEHSNSSNRKINNDYANMVKQSLGLNDGDSDEYNEYGLPPPEFNDSPKINEKKALLSTQSLKPKLRGMPGTMIDLSQDTKPNKNGVNALIDRFMNKHSKANKCTKDMPNVTATHVIESPNGLSVVKETLPYKRTTLVDEDPKLKKPGAKLVRLKQELKHKMALKRDEEWKQKEQEMKEQEIEWDESIIEDERLSEPRSPNIEFDISDEDELEEEDVYVMKDKKRKRSAYVDDEAEVSDDEVNDSDEIEAEDADNELQESSEDEKSDEENNDEEGSKCKTFKRILEPLDDDSRSSTAENVENTMSENKKISSPQVIQKDTFANEDEQLSENENDIQVFQADRKSDAIQQTPQNKTYGFDFVSPATQLTALNAYIDFEDAAEATKFTNETDPIQMQYSPSQVLSQDADNLRKQAIPHRKLFVDQNVVSNEQLIPDKVDEPNVTESQLLALCSGTFTSQVNDSDQSSVLSEEIPQSEPISFGKYSLSNNEKHQQSEDMPSCKKLRVLSSDEEDLEEDKINNRRKKKVKKLHLSDDENENSSIESNDDEEEEDEDEDNEEEDEEKFIDYDSEENEVVVSKTNIKEYAAKFVEEEAELSESDGGDVSADEDEKDLDKLEMEEGDDEDIDESQVKSQLGKLHMKQMMDEDQKEVKLLKELLFEEGDLYSESKRERKFKWRNIDKEEDNNESPMLDDKDGWVDLSDEEEEAKWREMKREREKFLAQRSKNVDAEIEEELNKSDIFRMGMKVLKKRRLNETEKIDTSSEPFIPTKITHSVVDMLNSTKLQGNSRLVHNALQRRSLLAKGEETLARWAAMARKKEAPIKPINHKNFVFSYIDRSTENKDTSEVKIQPKSFRGRRNRY